MNSSPPDAEALLRELAQHLRGHLDAGAAMVGIYTGGAWVAERLQAELKSA